MDIAQLEEFLPHVSVLYVSRALLLCSVHSLLLVVLTMLHQVVTYCIEYMHILYPWYITAVLVQVLAVLELSSHHLLGLDLVCQLNNSILEHAVFYMREIHIIIINRNSTTLVISFACVWV